MGRAAFLHGYPLGCKEVWGRVWGRELILVRGVC